MLLLLYSNALLVFKIYMFYVGLIHDFNKNVGRINFD